jgi:23S rRNA (cytidine1920-2'-O)/16S rRNA (cytidine1409-2'-O)-methyltransferase
MAMTFSLTRNKAQALIDAGFVSVNGKIVEKASHIIEWSEKVEIKEDKSIPWVSRSAGKLNGFLEEIGVVEVEWKNCLDIGSSTGGFTQILLERWVKHVDAVDVGTDQLHKTIKNDPRVTSYEKMDIRKFPSSCHSGGMVARNLVSEKGTYDIITCDVSFISLKEIVPELDRFAWLGTDIFLLFKPQFEVGRENLRKTWVPRDKKIVEQKLAEFEIFLHEQGFAILKKSPSTVIGEAGNEEWMMRLKRI